ncbi:MAG: hypothetical protein IPG35_18475 [Flavobacteriales bacterium]|nr:hypothetical protein [Flavobacteriales bacterium]
MGGLPAVAYHRSQTSDLYYERGGNVDWNGGTAIEVVVASTSNTGWYAQLDVVNGNPAIAFLDVTNTSGPHVRSRHHRIRAPPGEAPVVIGRSKPSPGNFPQATSRSRKCIP